MARQITRPSLEAKFILSIVTVAYYYLALAQMDGTALADLSVQQGYLRNSMRTRKRLLQVDTAVLGDSIDTLQRLPMRFTIRPMVDNTLCVNRLQLNSTAVIKARERSGLQPSDPYDMEKYGVNRLVLMTCSNTRTEIYLMDLALGRSYRIQDRNYKSGFLKNPSDTNMCLYGVNSTYTAGHPIFGVTGTQYYANDPKVPSTFDEDDEDMNWYDDYNFNYAPYIRYGYDPATMVVSSSFISPNPLPITMLDASGWGPFYSSWGTCMKNPTVDSATPTETVYSETELNYQTFIFVSVPGAEATAHLPRERRRFGFVFATLGPERPQPDMSPRAGIDDAGDLTNALNGNDKPYGTGYASLVSRELCMTTSTIREGAEVRLTQCKPATPSLEQVFQVAAVTSRVSKLTR